MLGVLCFWLVCLGLGCFYLRDYKKCLWERGLELTVIFISLEFIKGYLIILIGRQLFESDLIVCLGLVFTLFVTRLTKENLQSTPGLLCLLGALANLYFEALQLTLATWLSLTLITCNYKYSKYFIFSLLPLCLWVTRAPLQILGFVLLGELIIIFPSRLQHLINPFNISGNSSTFLLHEKYDIWR